MGYLYGEGGGGEIGPGISYLSERLGCVGCIEGSCWYQAMSRLIIDKSMVGIILCLIVLRNYTKV